MLNETHVQKYLVQTSSGASAFEGRAEKEPALPVSPDSHYLNFQIIHQLFFTPDLSSARVLFYRRPVPNHVTPRQTSLTSPPELTGPTSTTFRQRLKVLIGIYLLQICSVLEFCSIQIFEASPNHGKPRQEPLTSPLELSTPTLCIRSLILYKPFKVFD